MAKKFDLIIESALRRYQGTNFLIGDRVKFIDNFLTHEWTKSQPEVKVERLKALIESGDNIRVSAVKANRPATAQTGHFQDVDGWYVDIVREAAPGLMMSNEVYTLPDFLVQLIEDYPNLAGDTPDSQIRKDSSHIKPEEVDVADHEMSPIKQTGVDEGDRALTDVNTNIETAPAAKSTTAKYMEG